MLRLSRVLSEFFVFFFLECEENTHARGGGEGCGAASGGVGARILTVPHSPTTRRGPPGYRHKIFMAPYTIFHGNL